MDQAMYLAGIFGPFLMIFGLWMLFYHDNVMKLITSMKQVPSLLWVSGTINMLIGLAVLNSWNEWSWSLYVLLTIFGWFCLLRGLMIFFVPQIFIQLAMSNSHWLQIRGVLPLIWGFAMCWMVFWS